MSKLTLAELQKAAAALPSTELASLHGYISILRGAANAPAVTQLQDAAEEWYRLLSKALVEEVNTPQPRWGAFKKRAAEHLFSEACAEAEKCLHAWFGGRSNRLTRQSFRTCIATLIVRRALCNKKLPLWTSIAVTLRDLPRIVSEHYPGYIGSGMLHLIIEEKRGES